MQTAKFYTNSNGFLDIDAKNTEKYDLCPICAGKFIKWIRNEPKKDSSNLLEDLMESEGHCKIISAENIPGYHRCEIYGGK